MKCLSISQPFADLIISGEKTIEIRNWNTDFRGEFLIHAPIKMRIADCKRLKITKKMVTGVIIGKAELYDVKKYSSSKKVKEDQRFHLSSKNFQGKTFGFMLKNTKPLRVPIPWKGQFRFFDVSLSKKRSKDIVTDIIDDEYRFQWVGHH